MSGITKGKTFGITKVATFNMEHCPEVARGIEEVVRALGTNKKLTGDDVQQIHQELYQRLPGYVFSVIHLTAADHRSWSTLGVIQFKVSPTTFIIVANIILADTKALKAKLRAAEETIVRNKSDHERKVGELTSTHDAVLLQLKDALKLEKQRGRSLVVEQGPTSAAPEAKVATVLTAAIATIAQLEEEKLQALDDLGKRDIHIAKLDHQIQSEREMAEILIASVARVVNPVVSEEEGKGRQKRSRSGQDDE